MKKFVTAVAVVALVAFAAPVFAATNPFMDVPMNHWAYDAIGQLAAHGILSGYPDGLYKGKQPTTRYEMASALARALAVVDMTKASKQDVEMLQKLVVEFHDELEALGVRVDDIEGKVNDLYKGLGGWQLSGVLRMDISNESINGENPLAADRGEGNVKLSRARVQFDRYFGDPENPMHFRGILRGDDGKGRQGNSENWKWFYVEIPFFWDSLLTVGRNETNWESDYYYGGTTIGGWDGLGATLTAGDKDKIQWDKQFGMGKFSMYVAHDSVLLNGNAFNLDANGRWDPDGGFATNNLAGSAWELALRAAFQFNEQFGFDLGFQGFKGDKAENRAPAANDVRFNDMYSIFAGLRYNFNDSVAFKGIYYHQKHDMDSYIMAGPVWHDMDVDNSSKWSVMIDVKQDVLKFTSLWLEYGQVKQGFVFAKGVNDGNFFGNAWFGGAADASGLFNGKMLNYDLKFYRIALAQDWNEKWSTNEFYYAYDPDYPNGNTNGKLSEWGLGVTYRYNPSVTFNLNFGQADNGVANTDKDNFIRLRTQVTF